jgi:hypothetical protein
MEANMTQRPKAKRVIYRACLLALPLVALVVTIGFRSQSKEVAERKSAAALRVLRGDVLPGEAGGIGYVDLTNTMITDANLHHLANFPQIDRLVLRNTPTGDEGMKAVGRLTTLTSLDLANTDITNSGLAQLATLSNLEVLNLNDTRVSDAGLEHVQNLPKLIHLHLQGTRVTEPGAKTLQRMMPNCLVRLRPERGLQPIPEL